MDISITCFLRTSNGVSLLGTGIVNMVATNTSIFFMLYENKLEWLKSCMDYHQSMSKKGTSSITNYNSDWVFIPNIVSPPSKIQKLYYLQFSPKEVLL